MTIGEYQPRIRRVVHPDVPGPIGPRPSLRQRLVYSTQIRRVELLPVEVATCLVAVLVSGRSGAELVSPTSVIVFLTALSGMHFISMANALTERDIGAVDKITLSDAVYELGPRNVRRQIRLTGVVVAGFACYLSAVTGHWDILPLAAVMLCLGAPLHVRDVGPGQLPILTMVRLWVPMLLIVRGLPGGLEWTALAAIAGFGMCLAGIMLSPTAPTAITTAMAGLGGAVTSLALFAAGGLTPGLALLVATVVLALLHVSGTWRAVRGLPVDETLRGLRVRSRLVGVQAATTGWVTVVAAAFVLAGR